MNDVLEIKSKKYALELNSLGYPIIDFKKCSDGIHCIFKYSDEALSDFKEIVHKNKKQNVQLTNEEIKLIVASIEGYELYIDEQERLLLLFDKYLDSNEKNNDEENDEEIKEDIEVDVDSLKEAMTNNL